MTLHHDYFSLQTFVLVHIKSFKLLITFKIIAINFYKKLRNINSNVKNKLFLKLFPKFKLSSNMDFKYFYYLHCLQNKNPHDLISLFKIQWFKCFWVCINEQIKNNQCFLEYSFCFVIWYWIKKKTYKILLYLLEWCEINLKMEIWIIYNK